MRELDAEWMLTMGEAVQGVPVRPERAAELAANLRVLLDAVEALGGHLRFGDEPAAFLRALERHKHGAGR